MDRKQFTFTTADGTSIYSFEREQFPALTTVAEMLPALLTECADKLTALGYTTEPDAWFAEKGKGIPRNGGAIRLRKAPGTGSKGTTATVASVAPRSFDERVEERARELAFLNDIRPSEAREAALAELGAVAIQEHEHAVARAQEKVAELTAQVNDATAALKVATDALAALKVRLAPAAPATGKGK